LSSMISVFAFCQRSRTWRNFCCPRNFPAYRFEGSSPRPIPAQEWRVLPPILTAAIPVEAVIPRPP
ncbi:hypothetical protein FPV67DRAFT_1383382, partial [Lyophyllum atratum]